MTDYSKLKTRKAIIAELTKEFRSYDWTNLASFNHPGIAALRNFGTREKSKRKRKKGRPSNERPSKEQVLRLLKQGYGYNYMKKEFRASARTINTWLAEYNLKTKPNFSITENGKTKLYGSLADCVKFTGFRYNTILTHLDKRGYYERDGILIKETDNYDRL